MYVDPICSEPEGGGYVTSVVQPYVSSFAAAQARARPARLLSFGHWLCSNAGLIDQLRVSLPAKTSPAADMIRLQLALAKVLQTCSAAAPAPARAQPAAGVTTRSRAAKAAAKAAAAAAATGATMCLLGLPLRLKSFHLADSDGDGVSAGIIPVVPRLFRALAGVRLESLRFDVMLSPPHRHFDMTYFLDAMHGLQSLRRLDFGADAQPTRFNSCSCECVAGLSQLTKLHMDGSRGMVPAHEARLLPASLRVLDVMFAASEHLITGADSCSRVDIQHLTALRELNFGGQNPSCMRCNRCSSCCQPL